MNGTFIIREKNELVTTKYTKYEDIPMEFDHVIKFEPDFPEEPHTDEDHEYMETFNDKLQELMKREREQYIQQYKRCMQMPVGGNAVTRIGDADVAHCSGMTRAMNSDGLKCSGDVFANGIGISRQGDNNTSHLKPPVVCVVCKSCCTDYNWFNHSLCKWKRLWKSR